MKTQFLFRKRLPLTPLLRMRYQTLFECDPTLAYYTEAFSSNIIQRLPTLLSENILPKSVENLIKISRIRYICSKVGISSVIEKNGSVEFITTAESKAFYSVIQNITTGTEFMAKYGKKIKLVASDEPYLLYKLSEKNKLQEVLLFVEDILKFYHCKK